MDYLTPEQVGLLMRDLHPGRILSLDGNSYLAQWDVRAMLTRVFGFGRWSDTSMKPTTLLYEQEVTLNNGKPGWKVAYVAHRRLTVFSPGGDLLAEYDGTGVGEHRMPDTKRGDAHDNAIKTAESAALKRAAINLGTQFGLGLYGNTEADVVRVLAFDPRRGSRATELPSADDAMPEVSADDDLDKGEPHDG